VADRFPHVRLPRSPAGRGDLIVSAELILGGRCPFMESRRGFSFWMPRLVAREIAGDTASARRRGGRPTRAIALLRVCPGNTTSPGRRVGWMSRPAASGADWAIIGGKLRD